MMRAVSNTAEYGGRTRGPKVVDEDAREEMREMLEDIQEGSFAEEWMAENDKEPLILRK